MLPRQIQNKQILPQQKPQQLLTAKVIFAGWTHIAYYFSQQHKQSFVLLDLFVRDDFVMQGKDFFLFKNETYGISKCFE